MFQELTDAVYNNQYTARTPAPDDCLLLFAQNAPLLHNDAGQLSLPRLRELPDCVAALPFRCAFSLGERYYFLCTDEVAPFGSYAPLADFRALAPAEVVFACGVGQSLQRYYTANRFCGRCGAPLCDSKTERARVCPVCKLTVYPKICPAVIVAVTDGERLLLTKYKNRPFKRYALVGGFNEIGESIEDTVHREVREETGLEVCHLRFYKSQPWVFTDSLLMGFFCELKGSDAITVQQDELSEAKWHLRSELPTDHSPISLTGEMIEVFRRGG